MIFLLAVGVQAQERLLVGAYDPAHVNGVTLLAENGTHAPTAFGLRVLTYRPADKLEDAPPLERIRLFGPVAYEGAYARVHWDSPFAGRPLTLQWARVGPRVIVGQISTREALHVALETYRPFAQTTGALNFHVADEQSLYGEQLAKPRVVLRYTRFLLRTERKADSAASYADAARQRAAFLRNEPVAVDNTDAFAAHAYGALTFALKEKESVGFVMALGDDYAALEKEAEEVLRVPVAQTLARAESRFDETRPQSDGWLDDGLSALSRAVQWNRLYWPERQSDFAGSLRLVPTPGAQQAIGADAFFRALTAAWVDPSHAMDAVNALLKDQLPDGRIAPQQITFGVNASTTCSFNGRTLAPVGALTAWKIYLVTRDLQFLANVYPRLKRWHEWWLNDRGDGQAWRDGNGDGLLEWGYDAEIEVGELSARRMTARTQAQFALAQTGTAASPQWPPYADGAKASEVAALNPTTLSGHASLTTGLRFNVKAHTLELTPVGLNALYALDAEMLYQIARELGMPEDANRWEAHYLKLKRLIDERLWSEEDKLYLNRHWDGTFVKHVTPESFYVLAAGVPSPERARLMLEALRDPNRFGGQLGLPTLARGDAAFNPAEHWRGAIAAEANYLTYIGLKHYSFYAEAATLAQQSATLARDSWQQNNQVFDTYAALAGVIAPVPTPREKNVSSSYGALFWLTGLEELFAFDPWSGITIGNESLLLLASLKRLPFGGLPFTVHLTPARLSVQRGTQVEIECEPAARLLNYQSNERTISFYVESSRPLTIRIPSADNRPVSISVDNKLLGENLVGPAARLNIAPGIHRLVIVR